MIHGILMELIGIPKRRNWKDLTTRTNSLYKERNKLEPFAQALEEATQQLATLSSTIIILTISLSIVPYILFAIGLSSVANQCRIRHSWFAWLPIARKHLLAEVADVRRITVGKDKKLAVQYEVITCLFLACIYATSRTNNPIILVILVILAVLLSYNQAFSYYYFYRLCDRENAIAYFIMGLIAKPLNSFFVYHCR